MLLDRERMISVEGHLAGNLDLKKVQKQFKDSQNLIDSVRHTKAMGAEVLASAKFWVLMFTLAGVTKLEGGIDSLKSLVPSDENTALLQSTVEVPPRPIICEAGANPFQLDETVIINTTAAFCNDQDATEPRTSIQMVDDLSNDEDEQNKEEELPQADEANLPEPIDDVHKAEEPQQTEPAEEEAIEDQPEMEEQAIQEEAVVASITSEALL